VAQVGFVCIPQLRRYAPAVAEAIGRHDSLCGMPSRLSAADLCHGAQLDEFASATGHEEAFYFRRLVLDAP
jgi:hypothetical protein